ncbi:hypothetical protein BDV12DRAFT_43863 [Aspergillus spectabilis]
MYRHKHHNYYCLCANPKFDVVCRETAQLDCNSIGRGSNCVIRSRSSGISGPTFHIGTIASADTVIKSGGHRESLAARSSVIEFEMGGTGIWNNVLCLIIKGVCDYADSHKDKVWQPLVLQAPEPFSSVGGPILKLLLLTLGFPSQLSGIRGVYGDRHAVVSVVHETNSPSYLEILISFVMIL